MGAGGGRGSNAVSDLGLVLEQVLCGRCHAPIVVAYTYRDNIPYHIDCEPVTMAKCDDDANELMNQAADEIERLRKENAELRSVIESARKENHE